MLKKDKNIAKADKQTKKIKENKPKKPMPVWLKKTIIIASCAAAVVIISLVALLISAANSPQSGIEAFMKPISAEAKYIDNIANGEGFSINVNGDDTNAAIQYDGRTGDLAAEIKNNIDGQPNSAVYLRDNMLYYKQKDENTYYQTDSDITPSKPPISIKDRVTELWEKYQKQSDKKNMLKPYKKILNKAEKNMTKVSDKQSIQILGKDKNVAANVYTLNAEQSGEVIDQLLEQFTVGDGLYDFTSRLYERYGEEIFEDCATIEDALDLVDQLRSDIIAEQGSITWTQYKKGGLFGIGRYVIADKIKISTMGDNPITLEFFVMGYSKSAQYDKQLYLSYSASGHTVKQFNLDYSAIKEKGVLTVTGIYDDDLFNDGIIAFFNGTSNTGKDITTTSLNIDVTDMVTTERYSCIMDIELNDNTLGIYLDGGDNNYDIEVKNVAGNPVFPDFNSISTTEVDFKDIF